MAVSFDSPQGDAAWLQAQPLQTAHALPAPLYTDPAWLAREQHAVFARSWQLAAHAAQLAAAGDHVVAEIAGVPLLLMRGDDGVLRALHNVCRHRAGPLATCNGRGAKALRCKYHGWTYHLDGQLRSAPEMNDAADFDVGAIRLPQAQVAQWQGLVFVALAHTAPLAEQLAGIDARLHGHRIADYAFHHRVSYEVKCNWKAYVDN